VVILKILIITDLEGISGISNMDMIQKENPEFEYSAKRLMMDTNAAIEGAFEGGASYIKVIDGHAGGGNFIESMLDKRADLFRKNKGEKGLDETYSGVMVVGAHAMAGTLNGFLDHTQDSRKWFNYWVNGRRTGELGQWAMWAAHYNVPVIMVSGDEAACREAYDFFGTVECAPVKRGAGRNNAILADEEEALDRIKAAAKKAMSLIGKAKPFEPILPAEIKLELCRSDFCDEIAKKTGVERLDARTVRKIINSYLDWNF